MADSTNVSEVSQISSPFDVPDRLTGRAGLLELQALNPERRWNFVEVNVMQEELQRTRRERVRHLVQPLDTVLDDSIGCALWFAARGEGFVAQDSAWTPFSSPAKVQYSLQFQTFSGNNCIGRSRAAWGFKHKILNSLTDLVVL